jgi:hypothetical protein
VKEAAPAPETVHEETQADGAVSQEDVGPALTQLLRLVHVSTRATVLPAGPVPIELNFLVQVRVALVVGRPIFVFFNFLG